MINESWSIYDEDLHFYLQKYSELRDVRIELVDVNKDEVFLDQRAKSQSNTVPIEKDPPRDIFMAFRPQVIEEQLPITIDNQVLGYLEVRYFDPKLMNQDDMRLFDILNEIFVYMLISVATITLLMSFIVARSITRPIKKVSETAKSISDGKLSDRAEVSSRTSEIIDLSESINALGASLEQEDLLRKQVTSDMAHEIRTPLTSLRNFIEAFVDGVYEVNEENLMKCHSEVIRMSDLVDRLKDIAKIEEMNLVSKKEWVQIDTHIEGVCDMMAPEFDHKDIKLEMLLQATVKMFIDPSQLTQMLSNLLSNACRYTDVGGKVTVSLLKNKDKIQIKIQDTGIGIPEEDMPYIFERFYRSEKSRDRATGGMGVGLTIVKKLVDLNDGEIDVISQIGLGTSITLNFKEKRD